MLKARITGTGKYLPEKILTNQDVEKLCDTTDEWIRRRSGIEQRHVAADGEGVSDMATPAARMALENAGLTAKDLDAIICCTTTPDQVTPGSSCLIQANLDATNAAGFDINAACSGFVYGLTTVDALILSGKFKTILLVGEETVSRLLSWKFRDTAVLFGDAAGALIVQAEEGDRGILATHVGSDGGSHEILHVPNGGWRNPITAENVNDDPLRIYMNGPKLFKRAVIMFKNPPISFSNRLASAWTTSTYSSPIKQTGALSRRRASEWESTRTRCSSTSIKSATPWPLPFPSPSTKRRKRDGSKKGDNILTAAFGAGLTWGAAVIRW